MSTFASFDETKEAVTEQNVGENNCKSIFMGGLATWATS